MFIIILLFITTATCEWVEISQSYHRNDRPRLKHKANIDHLAEADIQYRNQTLTPQWSRGTVNKVENFGNVRRVPYATVKTPSIKPNMDTIETQAQEPYNYRYRLKSPDDASTLKPHIFEETHIYMKNPQSQGKTKFKNLTIFGSENLNEGKIEINEDYLNTFPTIATNFHYMKAKIENIPQKVTESTKSNVNQGIRRIYVEEKKKIPPENIVDIEITTSPSTPLILPKFENYHLNFEANRDNEQKLFNNSQKTAGQTDKHEELDDNMMTNSTNNIKPMIQENKMEDVWRIVKVVAETISKHSRKSLKGKLKYLEDLKDTIINNIENHVDRVWPDDADGARRSGRSAHERGHVEIPSSESALMTISFLTFAVFLIKLVLQVVHTYKHKTMMVTPAVVAAVGRTAAAFNRNKN